MELLTIVDENGKPIGQATREECHNRTFILHQVVHVLVLNSEGALLLQKRSMNKDIQPGKWDTSVGGHIHFGETLDEALIRETEEELGICPETLEKLYSCIMTSDVEREHVTTFRCLWDGSVTFQKSEIDEVRFFTPDEIESLKGSDFFTPNFEKEWECYKRWLISWK